MAAQSAGSHNVDVRELFNMLESNDINVSNDITKLVQENLASIKEAWLVCSLVDYYYISVSERTLQIIKDVREPHDKHLVDKLNEGLKSVEHRLPAMKILLSLACKQPIWVHKLVTHQIFHAIIKTLKTETDIPVVTTGVMTLTVLLPSVPALIGNQLTEIFTIFSRLIAFNERKPGNVPDVFLLHLQVALYSLFHRLYGMFPYNFLTFLRHHYNKKDNTKVFDEFVKPMLDRVRLHPHLITSSRDHEISPKRWRQMEAQDVVIECAKMSLDMTEGMWEELTCPILTPRHMVFQPSAKKPSLKLVTPEQDGTAMNATHQLYLASQELSPPCLTSGADGMGLWSPSVVVGLSTPPPSQQTTPYSNSYHDTSRYNYGNTPSATPPVDTPRATSPNNDDLDKSFSRTSSRSLLTAKGSELKRLSTGSAVSAKAGGASVTDGKPTSVPPSPLRAEFTSDPPQGPGIFKPVRPAIRELKFYPITEGQQSLDQERTESAKELAECERPDLMESFSMDTLPRVMEDLAGQRENPDNDDDNDDDQEVSELTSQTATLTAESVQLFMRKVNRIRFNSLTATNSISEKQKFGARSRSCPHLPKIESLESEGDETDCVSRSASATLKTMASPKTNDKLSPLQDQTILSESCPRMTSTNGVKLSVDKTTGSDLLTRTVTKEKSVPSCPVMSPGAGQDQSPDVSSKVLPNMFIDMMRTMLQPGSLLLCQKCNQSNADGSPLTALGPAGMATSFSPPELLDRHLRLGGEVHAKQLSKIPITSHDSTSWTHFGGMPPADEVNILRGQIFMIQNQLMYERHKRELHAKKNRRLLRKIANAKAVEEQNNAMSDQLSQYEREIQNMQLSLHLLQEENRRYKESQESNEYESKVQMRSCLAENEDLKSAKSELTTLLVRQREEQDLLKQRLQETESKLFKSDKEKCHLQEEVQFTQKLKEQVFTLHKEVLLMGELHQHYQEQINSARIHSKTKHEQDLHVMSQTAEITALKKALKSVTLTGEASQARVNQLEATVKTKDIALAEIKQSLADVITNHQEELKSIEEKYQCMLKVNQQLEGKILRLYSQVDELGRPRQTKESPDLKVSTEESPTRERTGSDPTIVTNVSKTPLCKMTSVPTYCEMKDHGSDMLAAGSSQEKHQPRNVSPPTTHSVGGDVIVQPNMTRTMECDNGSVSSRESGMFAPHRSVYSEGEDHSLSSRGSNLLDSGYST
ncbi:hamartin-like [Mizuhopecten yessoensis]|uniref:hamartin-like n=1 Tax=Mizuhopecten yessoensis TaxID=6573 RepID=UPI000B457AD7|nr:hamartin-like [Mizuhopecten yessoensis]XP_021365470.1 hamartin-like [Mizuhopecten yessoensis]